MNPDRCNDTEVQPVTASPMPDSRRSSVLIIVTPAQAGCGGVFKTRTNILVGCGKIRFHLTLSSDPTANFYDICTIRRRFIAAGFQM
jgi:hypothetical protein